MSTPDRILIVDDNPVNRRILVAALGKTGFETREAVDGFEAVDMAVEWSPDLILLDVNMPGRDGLEVCRILKSRAETAATPILFITALTGSSEIERGFAAGASDYIAKPFHLGEVKARVSVHLQLRRSQKELQRAHVELLQAQKLESVGRLAGGIAHEINTPMQFVGDSTAFLQSAFEDLAPLLEKARELAAAASRGTASTELAAELERGFEEADFEYLRSGIPQAIQRARAGLERIGKIVRAMKEFSYPSTKEKLDHDINRAIEITATVTRNEWKSVADLETDFDPELPKVPCLPGEFGQVVLNMIVNAAHAIADVVGDGSQGKGKITISTRRDGDFAEIRIADTGTGIPEEARDKVFDPFFTTKECGRGTGQGLFIAHTVVVQKHGGTLAFETEGGKGTTFVIRLPLGRHGLGEAA